MAFGHVKITEFKGLALGAAISGLIFGTAFPKAAYAIDEIQVYDASVAKPGEFTLQQHLNFALQGRRTPDFLGGLVSDRSLNGTPELAYGVTDAYEIGFYAPFAVSNQGQFYSDGFKIRQLFVTPHADERSFFGGVNFEFSYSTPKFSQTKFGLEIRPILGFRQDKWELIINPILDVGFGQYGVAELAPAVRLARKVAEDVSLGVEYYSALGPIGQHTAIQDQQHTIFGVIDFKVGKIDVNFGIGYGLTRGSDRLVAKTIVGTSF